MTTEPEIGVMGLQAKEWQGLPGPPKAGSGQEGLCPRAFGGPAALPTLIWHFWPPGL